MTARAAIVAFASLALASAGCSHRTAVNQPCCRATVTGRIRTAGGSPLDSALVGFNFAPDMSGPPYSFSAGTDAGGSYSVDMEWPSSYESPPGRVSMIRVVSRAGYRGDTSFVQVSGNTTFEDDATLSPGP